MGGGTSSSTLEIGQVSTYWLTRDPPFFPTTSLPFYPSQAFLRLGISTVPQGKRTNI